MSESQSPSQAVEVAIAEYNALRSEILTRTTAQLTIASIGLTIIGVAVGAAFSERGDARITIVVPFFAAAIIVVYAFESIRIAAIGRYLRHVLWPWLEVNTGTRLETWENYRTTTGRWATRALGEILTVSMFSTLGAVLAFSTPGISPYLRAGAVIAVAAATVIAAATGRAARSAASTEAAASADQSCRHRAPPADSP